MAFRSSNPLVYGYDSPPKGTRIEMSEAAAVE
jgi:hypothetical protein